MIDNFRETVRRWGAPTYFSIGLSRALIRPTVHDARRNIIYLFCFARYSWHRTRRTRLNRLQKKKGDSRRRELARVLATCIRVHRAPAACVTNNSHNLADDINAIRFIYNR